MFPNRLLRKDVIIIEGHDLDTRLLQMAGITGGRIDVDVSRRHNGSIFRGEKLLLQRTMGVPGRGRSAGLKQEVGTVSPLFSVFCAFTLTDSTHCGGPLHFLLINNMKALDG